MLYRDGCINAAQSQPDRISQLGLGCMRFARKGLGIDQQAAEEVMQAALDSGVNYFDTAYAYPGSEECVGKFLAKDGNRDKVLIATKMPHYQCKKPEDFERIFAEQLSRLQTDHIDYYLMHMITSPLSWQRAVDLGAIPFIERHLADGSIRHIGFSFHGGIGEFKEVADAYSWDFCQIQLNYLDAHAQAGLDGLDYAVEKGLPVIIMEPLRGGRLADKLPSGAKRIIDSATPQMSPASWGFQWLYNLPGVTCVLSGMNEVAQVEENAELAGRVAAGSLDEATGQVYERLIAEIKRTERVGCTGCGYCMPCPQGVDIPTCFRCYNIQGSEGWYSGVYSYITLTALKAEPTNAGRCIGCGRCEKHCPQHIPIREELKNVQRKLEGPVYKVVKRFKGVYWKV